MVMDLRALVLLGALAACSTHASPKPAAAASTGSAAPVTASRNVVGECPVLMFHPIAPLASLPIYGAAWPGRSRISYRYDAEGRLVEESMSGGRDAPSKATRHVYDCP